MTPPLLELSEAQAPYGLVAPISLTLQPGCFIGVIGPNGAGKSTLIKLCAGALTPSRGRVELEGAARWGRRAFAQRVAYVPQEIGMGFEFNVEEVVAMGRHPHRRRLSPWSGEDRAAVEAALRDADLEALRGRSVRRLSGGERQRVALARALAQAPKLLILDEPTAHLDMAHAERMLTLLDRAQRRGVGILIALHDLNLAARYCHELLLLHEGQLRGHDRPAALLTEARLSSVFGAALRIIPHPDEGHPQILGRRPSAPGHPSADAL